MQTWSLDANRIVRLKHACQNKHLIRANDAVPGIFGCARRGARGLDGGTVSCCFLEDIRRLVQVFFATFMAREVRDSYGS